MGAWEHGCVGEKCSFGTKRGNGETGKRGKSSVDEVALGSMGERLVESFDTGTRGRGDAVRESR